MDSRMLTDAEQAKSITVTIAEAARAAIEQHRIHLRSPRLAEPGRAADFAMEVAEVAPGSRTD